MTSPDPEIDFYTLLEVPPDAGPDQIRRAFHVFALRHHPDRHGFDDPGARERAERVYRRGAEAYRVLCDPDQRRLYDERRARGARRNPEEQTVSHRPAPTTTGLQSVRSPRARPFAQKAMEALGKGEIATARLNLKLALQYDPGNAWLEGELASLDERARGK